VTGERTTVVLAEDDVLLREGMAGLLEQAGFEVIGQAGTGDELLALVRERRPQLVELPQTAIMILSAHAEVEHALDLLAGGQRSGYLLKSRVADVEEFVAALTRVVNGGSVVDQALVGELLSSPRVDDPLEEITQREREVLALMAEGRSNAGIARILVVTEGTVEKHVHSILGKLRLSETEDDHRRVLAVLTYLEAR